MYKAQIIETNGTPLATGEVDPITLDIIESALRNTRYEMDAVLFRTAMSPGIREQHDEFPLIADRKGRMVVGQFGSFVDGFLKSFAGTVEEGDIFLTSDPYSCDGAISHLNDWLVLLPIFYDGLLVGWGAMFGHMTDVGGKVPGSLPTDATTIFEEGLRIPPIKIYNKGRLNQTVLEVILQQCRLPHWNRSDFNAIVAACRTAEKRVKEMCGRFGVETYCAALEAALGRNQEAMRTLFRMTVPEGEKLTFEDYLCDDGRGFGPYKLKCSLLRTGDRIHLDWTGTDPQAFGSINYYLNENLFKMFFGVYMVMVFDPQILFNDGFYNLVDVTIPEGTLMKPTYPAALSCRTHALGRMFDVLGGLLGQRQPEFLCAAGFSSSPHLMYSGYDQRNQWYQLFQIGFGGIPGKPFGDGPDGHSLWPSFTNVPNEFLEAYFPLRIERYATVPDSGGAGKNRGGNGVEIVYCFLEPGEISIHDDRWFLPPWGVNGGEPAARSRKLLVRTDGTTQPLPAKCDRIAVQPGDLLHFITWGGAGWGDPLDRDPALVIKDVKRGLVSAEGARKYGVVVTEGGQVDAEATTTLREEMRASRGPLPVFNFGRSVEELRRACKAETGLEAPMPPVFTARKATADPQVQSLERV
jgi:N-methylhydantoinase B